MSNKMYSIKRAIKLADPKIIHTTRKQRKKIAKTREILRMILESITISSAPEPLAPELTNVV